MNLAQWLGLIILVVSLYILWQIRQVLMLVFAAIVLATALNRLARLLQRFKMKRIYAVVMALVIAIAVIVLFFRLVVPPFTAEFQQLTSQKLPEVLQLFGDWENQIKSYVPEPLLPYFPNLERVQKEVQPFINRILGGSVAFVSGSLGAILNFLLVVVLTIMLLVNPEPYRQSFIKLFPSFYRKRADGIVSECEVSLGAWMSGALISMSVIAVLSWIGLSLLHVRLALVNGVIAGVLNFIPNIGPTMSVILPMAIAFLDSSWKPFAVLGLYLAIQQFETNFLTPYIMSQQVSLLPAMTLLSQVIFTTAFGSLGLLLSIPLTVVTQVWIKEALIKDIMDEWRAKNKQEVELVVIPESNEQAEAITDSSRSRDSVSPEESKDV